MSQLNELRDDSCMIVCGTRQS